MSCSSQRGPGHGQGTIQAEMGQQAQYRTGSARESHLVGVDQPGPAFSLALGLLVEGWLIGLDSKSASLDSFRVELNNHGAEEDSSKIQRQLVLFESLEYHTQYSGAVTENGHLLPGYEQYSSIHPRLLDPVERHFPVAYHDVHGFGKADGTGARLGW